jgi:MFS family permease
MGIFNTGAAVGGALSPPLIAWLATIYGWRMTFVVTGRIGFRLARHCGSRCFRRPRGIHG